MSEKFTASNGVVVAEDDHGLTLSTTDWRKGREALAELFLHERDQELGRWRWPEDLNYVVYKDGTSRRVVCESTGQMMQVSQHQRKVMTTYLESYVGAARAYDASHPLPKPWHDAKPGEVWVVAMTDIPGTLPLTVVELRDGIFFKDPTDDVHILVTGQIDSARRIWPEAVES